LKENIDLLNITKAFDFWGLWWL